MSQVRFLHGLPIFFFGEFWAAFSGLETSARRMLLPGNIFTLVTVAMGFYVFGTVTAAEKENILRLARGLLAPGGLLHVADYGLQRTALMRAGFRIVQSLDGYENTAPNARGILPGLMNKVGFSSIEEMLVVPTLTGSISLYRAARD